jgi:hypothetical protein
MSSMAASLGPTWRSTKGLREADPEAVGGIDGAAELPLVDRY